MKYFVLLCALLMLSILPGAWLGFGLPIGALGSRVRLAFAVALSPAVIGVEMLLLKGFGIPFETVAVLVLYGNLPSLLLIIRSRPTFALPSLTRGAQLALLMAFALVVVLALPWLLIPNFGTFAWHALIHSDIIYKLTDAPLLPEEPELVGTALSYAWGGHAYWSVLGIVTDIPPTRLFTISNVIWLLVSAYLLYEIARKGFRMRQSGAVFCMGLVLLGTQSIAYAVRVFADYTRFAVDYFGYQLSPILQKFRGFETMPFAFALFLALMLVIVWRLHSPLGAAGAIEASLLIGAGIVYPIMVPLGLILMGSQVLLILSGWARDVRPFTKREIGFLILGIAAAFGIFAAIYYLYTRDTHGPMPVSFAGRQTKMWQSLFGPLPFLILALPAAIRALRVREAAPVLLLWTAGCALVLHVILNLAHLEYKFVLAASMLLGPIAALTVDHWFTQRPRWEWAVALGVPTLLICVELLWTFRLGGLIPVNRVNAPQINQDHFQLRLAASEADAAWVDAVREKTPLDTVLVATGAKVHLGPFVRRTLYAPSDADGQASTGYSVDNRDHLVNQRRYDAQDYDNRVNVITEFFHGDAAARRMALDAMLVYRRPLAIHFSDPNAAALHWLREQGIGGQLFTDGRNVVWLIEPTASSR